MLTKLPTIAAADLVPALNGESKAVKFAGMAENPKALDKLFSLQVSHSFDHELPNQVHDSALAIYTNRLIPTDAGRKLGIDEVIKASFLILNNVKYSFYTTDLTFYNLASSDIETSLMFAPRQDFLQVFGFMMELGKVAGERDFKRKFHNFMSIK